MSSTKRTFSSMGALTTCFSSRCSASIHGRLMSTGNWMHLVISKKYSRNHRSLRSDTCLSVCEKSRR